MDIKLSISAKKAVTVMIGVVLNVYVDLGSTAVTTVLSLPVREHRMCSPLFHLTMFFSLQCISLAFLVLFIPRYFIPFDVFINHFLSFYVQILHCYDIKNVIEFVYLL